MNKEQIQKILSIRLNKKIILRLNRNRSTFLSIRAQRDGSYKVSLHECFLHADENTLDTVGRFIKSGKTADRNLLREFVQNQKLETPPEQQNLKLITRGSTYDLKLISSHLNEIHFRNELNFQITWNNRAPSRKKRVRQMTLGKCYFSDQLITIHPILDQVSVPQTFIEFVVFHEMCHLAIAPQKMTNGNMLAHSPEFKSLERTYSNYDIAKTFEDKHLPKLIDQWHRKNAKRSIPSKKNRRTTWENAKDKIQMMLF